MKKKIGSIIVFVLTAIIFVLAISLCITLPIAIQEITESASNNSEVEAQLGALFTVFGLAVAGIWAVFVIGVLGAIFAAISVNLACNRTIKILSIIAFVLFVILDFATIFIAFHIVLS